VNPGPRWTGNGLPFLAVVALGCVLSLALYQIWDLENRWIVVICLIVAAATVAMCLARSFSDYLLIGVLFSLPVASFSKWFYYEDIYTGAFGIGLLDLLLGGLYVSWFYRVFVIRVQPPPRLTLLDGFIFWFILAYLLGTLGSREAGLGLAATEYLVKYTMVYFYLSRHIEERHLPWLLAAFAFTVFLDASLGSYQFSTGRLLGLGLDRGAGTSQLDTQYHVPGTGSYNRASGTSYDSHALGHLMSLIVTFPLVLCFMPGLRLMLRFGCAAVAAAALFTLVLTLSRSGYFSCAIGLTIGVGLIIVLWREPQAVVALAIAVMVAAVVTPLIAKVAYDRIMNAPSELLTYRFSQYAVGWYVFTLHPLFGVGPGSWMQALKDYDFLGLEQLMIHNVIIQVMVEMGVFGLFAYLSIVGTAMLRLFRLARRRRDIAGRFALAGLVSLIITLLDGLTDPAFRDPNVFLMFWLLVSLSVALPRLRPDAGAILMAAPQPAAIPRTAAG